MDAALERDEMKFYILKHGIFNSEGKLGDQAYGGETEIQTWLSRVLKCLKGHGRAVSSGCRRKLTRIVCRSRRLFYGNVNGGCLI